MPRRTHTKLALTLTAAISMMASAPAQGCPANLSRVAVEVMDSTGAGIVGADITFDGAKAGRSDAHGQWTSACGSGGTHRLGIAADGFAQCSKT